MPHSLELTLFGSPEVRLNGNLVTGFRTGKAQALLYYLAVTGRPHTRPTLAGLFWGDQAEAAARASLSKCLSNLHDLLGAAVLVERQSAAFNRHYPYQLDTERFAAGSKGSATSTIIDSLQTAIAFYRGDFLEGFYVRDAPDFEQWVLVQRAHYREAVVQGLHTLANFYEQQGELPQAIAHTRRLLALEPWREEAHRQLMTRLARSGQRVAALAQFEACRKLLDEELAVEPDAETVALFEAIRSGTFDKAVATGTSAGDSKTPKQIELATLRQTTPPLAVSEFILVGRQPAWQHLSSAWQTAQQTSAQFVCISGEAGIGKTRLAEELLLAVHSQGQAAARTRAYALEGRLTYAPLAEWLRTPPLQEKLAKLAPIWLTEVARLLPELLLQHPSLPAPQPLAERWQQKQFFDALLHAFTVAPRPLLLLLDDLQWCDADTLAWLQYLLETAPKVPLLVVGTVRSDEVDEAHPLHRLRRMLLRTGQLTTIDLTPLSAAETVTLGEQVAKHGLDNQAATQLYQTTGGNPLFVIESVRAGTKAGAADDDSIAKTPHALLPPKVYAVIEARLAQLSPSARSLAQAAATIGRAFTVPLLVAVSQQPEAAVVQAVDELWQRRLLREQGNAHYDFSHDRIRDVAYAEISPARRRWLHHRVAEGLESIHAAELDGVSGQLATHYELASLSEKAVVFYQRAGAVAQQIYAHAEATHQLNKGLALLQQLPVTPERLQQELRLQFALAISLVAAKGSSADVVQEAYVRTQALAIQVGDDSAHLVAVAGLHISALTRGQLQSAYELAIKGLALAQQIGESFGLVEAYGRLGTVLFYLGQWQASRVYLEQALAQPEYHWDAAARLLWPHHQGITTRRMLAFVLWHVGYPDLALAEMEATVAWAQEVAHPYTLAAAIMWLARVHLLRREPTLAQAQAEQGIRLCQQYGYRYYWARCTFAKGWALAQQGQGPLGSIHMQEGIDAMLTMGNHLDQPVFLGLLAEIYGQIGKPEQALHLFQQALEQIEATDQRFFEAELHRLKGELLQMQGADEQEVEPELLQALTIARQQEAKSLELRAALSLARLWQRQGKRAQAHDLLAEIYGWFTEGFETADLKEAKALLSEL